MTTASTSWSADQRRPGRRGRLAAARTGCFPALERGSPSGGQFRAASAVENAAQPWLPHHMSDRTRRRRYTIEIKDPDNKAVVFAAAEWTDNQCAFAVAQVLRLAGLPGDAFDSDRKN